MRIARSSLQRSLRRQAPRLACRLPSSSWSLSSGRRAWASTEAAAPKAPKAPEEESTTKLIPLVYNRGFEAAPNEQELKELASVARPWEPTPYVPSPAREPRDPSEPFLPEGVDPLTFRFDDRKIKDDPDAPDMAPIRERFEEHPEVLQAFDEIEAVHAGLRADLEGYFDKVAAALPQVAGVNKEGVIDYDYLKSVMPYPSTLDVLRKDLAKGELPSPHVFSGYEDYERAVVKACDSVMQKLSDIRVAAQPELEAIQKESKYMEWVIDNMHNIELEEDLKNEPVIREEVMAEIDNQDWGWEDEGDVEPPSFKVAPEKLEELLSKVPKDKRDAPVHPFEQQMRDEDKKYGQNVVARVHAEE